jgi:hypothetical protein
MPVSSPPPRNSKCEQLPLRLLLLWRAGVVDELPGRDLGTVQSNGFMRREAISYAIIRVVAEAALIRSTHPEIPT